MRRPALLRVSGFALVLVGFGLSTSHGQTTYGWDGELSSLWGDAQFVPGTGLVTNWSPEGDVPVSDDRVVFAATSAAGPVTIDLGGVTQSIVSLRADGVEGVYTLSNGVLELGVAGGNAILAGDGGGDLVIDADLLLSPDPDSTHLLNVTTNGGSITVNGGLSTSQPTGITTLTLTSRNDALAPSVAVNGDISDGAGRVQLVAGFNGDLLNHTGVVRVTGANTFTGAVGINAAILEFDSIEKVGGPANALGQAPLADSAIFLGTLTDTRSTTATLRYLGDGHTSDRVIRLSGGSNDIGVIEASGTGPLVLTGGIANPASTQVLHLGGANTETNTLSGPIAPGVGSAVTNVRKVGDGKWILSGSSPDLDGSLVAANGELVLTGSIGTTTANAGAFQVNGAGTFTLDGGYLAASNLSKSPSGVINFQSGTIRVTSATTSPSTFTGPLVVGTDGAGLLQLQGGSKNFDDLTLHGADDTLELAGGGTWEFTNLDNSAGGQVVSTATNTTVRIAGGAFTHRVAAGTTSVAARLTGTGGLTKLGPGTLEIGLSNNSYTGATIVEEGTLKVSGATDGLSSETDVTVMAGATLDFTGATNGEFLGGLNGAGQVLVGGDQEIRFTAAVGEFHDFSGSLAGPGGASGQVDLSYAGPGRQIVSGTVDIEGTTTLVGAGTTLQIAEGAAYRTAAVNYSLNDSVLVTGGVLDVAGNVTPSGNTAQLRVRGGVLRADAINRNGSPLSEVIWTGGTVELAAAISVRGSSPNSANPFGQSVSLDDDMALIANGGLTADGNLVIAGGSVTAATLDVPIGAIDFQAGALRIVADQTLDSARLAELDLATPLGANRSFAVEGVATVEAPLVLAGGTFSAGQVVNPENLILASGTLEVTSGDLTIAAGETLDATTGMTIDVTAGGLVVEGQLNAINATLSASGGVTIGGEPGGEFTGELNLIDTVVNGSLKSGTSGSANLLGTNRVTGDLGLGADSSLLLAISGDADFDTLTVGGAAVVDGAISVQLRGGFSPFPGQQFEVLTAASLLDNGLTLSGVDAGGFDLLVGADSVILRAVGGLPGDFNGDGRVDAADYTVYRDTLGQTGVGLAADGNGNGLVDAGDRSLWAANFGSALPAAAATIPEPCTMGLVVLAFLAAGRRSER